MRFLLPIHDFRENGSTCITFRQSVSQSVRQVDGYTGCYAHTSSPPLLHTPLKLYHFQGGEHWSYAYTGLILYRFVILLRFHTGQTCQIEYRVHGLHRRGR